MELREKRNVPVKALCAEIGMEKWDWSRKTRFDRSSFTLEEIGAIAEALDASAALKLIHPAGVKLIHRAG